MEALDELTKKAIELRPTERIKLVEAILYSFDKIDPDVLGGWIAESETRCEAYKNGEIEARDWEEIKKRLPSIAHLHRDPAHYKNRIQ